MAILKAFKGYRPQKDIIQQVASRPYDVLNSDEARTEVDGNPYSFLHVVKPEVDLPVGIDLYSEQVYAKGKENLDNMISTGKLVQDDKPCLYVYAQTWHGKTQYGLVGGASIEDYQNNIIKKHELTRPDKENDRVKHVDVTNFNAEPVFFTYPDNAKINEIISLVVKNTPDYDFQAEDGIQHTFWVISNQETVRSLENIFSNEVEATYVADGHHRTAAAWRVGELRKKNNPNHQGNEQYNYFLAVHFPASQLTIIDYNRVVKDLNDLSTEEFIEKLNDNFEVSLHKNGIYKPTGLHEMSMYLDKKWYVLKAKPHTYNDNDPIKALDVNVLSEFVLSPILDITDLRKSKRIDFVGGIRGLEELEKRVDSGEMKAAFALYPVSMQQLIDIADTGNIMPPKTTWFEPKLRSGLVIHSLED